LSNFRRANALSKAVQDYGNLRIWLIKSRTGKTTEATTELKNYMQTRPLVNDDGWYLALAAFVAGDLTEKALLKSAEEGQATRVNEKKCEAYFYAGMKNLLAGRKTVAANYFQSSIDTAQKNFTEYQSSKAELKRLDEKK